MQYVSGELFQELADCYLGMDEDFAWNPRIAQQPWKHCRITDLEQIFFNPPILFCYTHRIGLLAEKITCFVNPFVLITHNSDSEIRMNDPAVAILLHCPQLVGWFAQNLCFTHSKLKFLPIGIANLQWEHGLDFMNWFHDPVILSAKTRNIYMCFDIFTCPAERKSCLKQLCGKIPILDKVQSAANFRRMEEYQFAICPVGNGVDTHRFWECLYLQCVPIVVRNPLVDILQRETFLPMVVLECWSDFNSEKLPDYETFDFECPELFLEFYQTQIIKFYAKNA